MRTDIDALFFDFGGVLLTLHFDHCIEAFKRLGADASQETLFRSGAFNEEFDRLEKGLITAGEFFATLRRLMHFTATDAEMLRAWNLIIGTVPLPKLQLLRELRSHYRIYMVSNTNAPHFDYTREAVFRDEGLTVNDYFDKLYLSQELHTRKPHESFYRKVLDDCGESPARSFFFDDLAANIEGAKQAGFHTCLIDPEEDLRKKILELLA